MQSHDLNSMSIDELWELHERVITILASKTEEEKSRLEKLLAKLKTVGLAKPPARERRPYPPVVPKYRNPKKLGQTWAGKGKQLRWLQAQL